MFAQISKRFEVIIAVLTVIFLTACTESKKELEFTPEIINLAHLEHLMMDTQVNGRDCSIVYIYCEAPDYHWVGDSDEGISCVDDVARAARVFINDYKINKNIKSAEKAEKLLNFILAMQTEDGQFYNFIWPDYTINKEHKNSVKSMGWWAARGLRALASGASSLKSYDPTFAEELEKASIKTITKITLELNNKDSWISNIAPDQAAEYVLGLLQAKTYTEAAVIDPLIEFFVARMLQAQWQNEGDVPSTVHFAFENTWHAWGSQMVQALSEAGKTLEKQEWIDSALSESQTFHRELIVNGYLNYFSVENNTKENVLQFPQIAYGFSGMIAGNISLYSITGLDEYALTAGWFASWLNGGNLAGIKMYDAVSGRTFDGLLSTTEANENSGAESTIEALLALQKIQGVSIAQQAYSSVPEYNPDHTRINFKYNKTTKQAELPMSIVLEDGHWVIK